MRAVSFTARGLTGNEQADKMRKFLIDYGDSTETLFFPSKKILKYHLHRKLNKQRLHGIIISEIKNNFKTDNNLKPVEQPDIYQEKCSYCGKTYPEEEITLDDSLIAANICESCLKHHRQIT